MDDVDEVRPQSSPFPANVISRRLPTVLSKDMKLSVLLVILRARNLMRILNYHIFHGSYELGNNASTAGST